MSRQRSQTQNVACEPSFACPCLLAVVSGNFDHGRTQQAILELISTLPLLKHFVIRSVGRIYHLNGLVHVWIELLALGGDRTHPNFAKTSCNCL